jgi:hypothetical protein
MVEIEKEIKTIKDLVQELLDNDERCRGDDKWLILRVLRKLGFKIYVEYRDLADMPSFETITRCRRKIQEEKPDSSPSEEILLSREKRQEDFREYFSNKNS